MTDAPDWLDIAFDEWQAHVETKWSPEATGDDKTLVYGNVRGFIGFLHARPEYRDASGWRTEFESLCGVLDGIQKTIDQARPRIDAATKETTNG